MVTIRVPESKTQMVVIVGIIGYDANEEKFLDMWVTIVMLDSTGGVATMKGQIAPSSDDRQ